MSNRRQDTWSLGSIAAAGVGVAAVAGLGYALYKLSSEEDQQTIRNALSFDIKKCEICKEVFQRNDEIKLLCNHHFHKNCLLSAYSHHATYSSSQFMCPAADCYLRIHKSVIDSVCQQRNSVLPALTSNNATKRADKCKLCDRDLIFGKSIELSCGHVFHENCFLGNCVLHTLQRGDLTCPIATCHQLVPQSTYYSLAKNFYTK